MYSYENINLINKALKLITILLVTLIEFLTSILIFYFIFVTFGAGIKTSIHRTLFFSLLSCLFCVMPSIIFLKHDNPFRLIQRILVENDCKTFAENVCAYIALGFVVGSWFGALFIPLGNLFVQL